MDANGVKKKPSLGRKVLLGIGGLLALCCGLSVVAAVVAPPSAKATPTPGAVAVAAATAAPSAAPTKAPSATAMPEPTKAAATATGAPAAVAQAALAQPTPSPSQREGGTAAGGGKGGLVGEVTLGKGVFGVPVAVVDPAKGGILFRAEAGKRLVGVEVAVGNTGDKRVSVNPVNFSLVDGDGFVYRVDLGGCETQLDAVTLQPGERARGLVCYQVAEKAKLAALKGTVGGLFDGQMLEMGLGKGAGAGGVKYPERVAAVYVKKGDTASVDGLTLAVVNFEEKPKPGLLYRAKAGWKLVAAEIVVGNTGEKKVSVNPLYARLVDTDGFVWETELGGRDGAQLDSGEIGKGEKAKGWVSFVIPADATPAAVRVTNGGLEETIVAAGVR